MAPGRKTSYLMWRRVDQFSGDCYDFSAGWSSQVARWAHNPKVASSNLAPATKLNLDFREDSTSLPKITNQSCPATSASIQPPSHFSFSRFPNIMCSFPGSGMIIRVWRWTWRHNGSTQNRFRAIYHFLRGVRCLSRVATAGTNRGCQFGVSEWRALASVTGRSRIGQKCRVI
jgi:hypothetical protein